MDRFWLSVKEATKGRLFRYCVPFLVLIVGGSFGLKEFASIRYEFRRTRTLSKDELEEINAPMKPFGSVTIETEYEKLKEIDIDTWENIRGPRPWEDNSEYNELKQRNKGKETN